MKPEGFYVHLLPTQDLGYASLRERLAISLNLRFQTWHAWDSDEIYQRVDAETEQELSFYLLSLPEK